MGSVRYLAFAATAIESVDARCLTIEFEWRTTTGLTRLMLPRES